MEQSTPNANIALGGADFPDDDVVLFAHLDDDNTLFALALYPAMTQGVIAGRTAIF